MDIEIRTITADEFDPFSAVFEAAFSGDVRPDEIENERRVAEFDRCHVAIEGTEFVGAALAASFRMTVPGGKVVRAAGVTGVGVKPSHRRRGINTALMRRQLDDVRERGEPLAVLHASEGGIYGRFGYGLATFECSMEIETKHASYVRGYVPSGRVRLLDWSTALPMMKKVYDAVYLGRPGFIELDDPLWEWSYFESERDKDEPPFYAVHESDDGRPDAFAAYSAKHEWPGSVPRLELTAKSAIATNPQSYADIWRYLFDIDLVERVKAWNRPADEPLLHMLQEPRRLRLTVKDGMWARLVDVPAALAGRGYSGEGRVAIEVRDAFCPWNDGRFALDVGPKGAVCEPTRTDPDLVCSATDLGAVYLGGSTFRQLNRAGHVVEERPGALGVADAIFASDPAPWSQTHF